MTKKIDEKARAFYFASEQTKKSRIDEYTDAYRKGYMAALCEIRDALESYPNNKERLNAINKIIQEYGN